MHPVHNIKSIFPKAGLILALFGALGFSLAPIPAKAFGGGAPAPKPHNCPRGKIWSKSHKKCVWKNSGLLNDQDRFDYGYALAKHGQYAKALDVLESITAKNDPKVLNYIGYSHRKMGRFSTGISYYKRAIDIDPDYVRAREYLGEGYVASGKLTLAKAQLTEIANRCGTACEEYQLLDAAIKNGPAKGAW